MVLGAGGTVDRLNVQITGSSRGFRRAVNRARGATRRLRGAAVVGMRAVAGVGAAVGAGLALSAREAAGFGDKLNESLAIVDLQGFAAETNQTLSEVRGQFRETAFDVAESTRFSADEAAESYFFLASAGLDAAQQLEALPQVAQFAQAGMFDMAEATDIATDAQSALGLTSDDAEQNLANLTRVTDVLVSANKQANASVRQFGEALTNQAAAALKTTNKEIEEGVAVLAAFADQGLKGRKAGIALSRILNRLPKEAQENAQAFEELGVQVFDSEGNLRNMADIVEDMETALKGMSDAEKTAALQSLGFGLRLSRNIQQLMGTSDEIRTYEEALRDAGGTTEEVADRQMESFSAKLDVLRSKVEVAAIRIGGPVLDNVMALGEGFAASFQGGDRLVEQVIGSLEALVPVSEEAGRLVGELVSDLLAGEKPDLATPVNKMIDALAELPWEAMAQDASDALVAALETLNETLAKVDWEKLGSAIGDAIRTFLEDTHWGKVGEEIARAIALEIPAAVSKFSRGLFGLEPSEREKELRQQGRRKEAEALAITQMAGAPLLVADFELLEKTGGEPGVTSLQRGGIVRRPTLAMIGEAGPEAVVPLSGNQGRGPGFSVEFGPGSIVVHGNEGQDPDMLAERVADRLEDRISQQARRWARQVF